MTTTLQKQAWQSGLVLLDETPEWNFEDWPSLEGGCREAHATVVLYHTDNNKEQTVVVLGGYRIGQGEELDSVLVLNLADPNKQWRVGPPMNKKRVRHAAVVCNGGIYVVGGNAGYSRWDCMERINANDLLQSSWTSSSTQKSHWTTLNCRLSTERSGCGAVAVHNRYIVVMAGCNGRYLSSVDIIDTRNHAVTAGPSMSVPRQLCASAVIGHRIFVVGGWIEHGRVDSVEYLNYAAPCENDETTKEIAFSLSGWKTHSDLVLSDERYQCTVAVVGSCLVVAGGDSATVEILDTNRNRVWNLPQFVNHNIGGSMVTVANQIAMIAGFENPTCATFPLMDKNTWCFCQLCEQQQPSGWYHSLQGMGYRVADILPCLTSTSARKRARKNTRQNEKGSD